MSFITDIENINTISPSRICNLREVIMMVDGSLYPIPLEQNDRRANMSITLLEHIREYGYETSRTGHFVIDLKYWKYNKSIFTLPSKEYNYAAHGKVISRMIESKFNSLAVKKNESDPCVVVSELFDLVNSKLNVNLSLLEVILYAVTAADPENNNVDLSRGNENASLYNGERLVFGRTLSSMCAFKNVHSKIIDPASYIPDNRTSSPFDAFLCPNDI